MEPQPKPIIVIVGQTASGKSGLAMHVAQQFDGEIICADSRTIYKDMNIGTAKPSAADQKKVLHHGLDLITPNEYFSAAAFQAYAKQKVTDIQTRGKLPIIVGGTGLYIDGFVYDFSFAGEADPLLRNELEAMSLEDLQIKARQLSIDEIEVDFQNPRHLSRIIERTAQNPSQDSNQKLKIKMQPNRKLKPKNILVLGMQIEQEQLNQRIVARVDTMFDDGLLREVQNLINLYGSDAPGLLAAGYRELVKHLSGESTLDEAKELFVRSHKYLAKRQKTWFKRNQDIIWVQSEDRAIEYIINFTKV